VWIQGSYNPILDSHGKPYKVVTYATDITAAKRMEAEMRAGQLRERQEAEELRGKVDSILGSVNAAAGGDLTQAVEVAGSDAIGQVGEALTQLLTTLRTSIASIALSSATLAGSSEELSTISTQMSA
jgi:methyl-accepting chemotaxis protein